MSVVVEVKIECYSLTNTIFMIIIDWDFKNFRNELFNIKAISKATLSGYFSIKLTLFNFFYQSLFFFADLFFINFDNF